MLRELKHNKFKKKDNTFEMLANEHAHLRKRDLKGQNKERINSIRKERRRLAYANKKES